MKGWVRPPGPVAPGLHIGLLGGSFNPAHDGHRYISDVALRQLGLDYVWWLVSPQNPLKPVAGMAPLSERLATAGRVAQHPRIRVTDIEREMDTQFSFDTVSGLKRRFPQVRFVWLMGSDNLAAFRHWRRWADFARLVPIAVVLRPGSVMKALEMRAIEPLTGVTILDGKRNPLSATAIRAGLVAKRPA